MKKLLMVALLSSVLITILFQPVTVGAEEIDWRELAPYDDLLLMEEAAGQKITKVSTEPVNKETVTYDFGVNYSVGVSASMDGKEFVDLYSSDTTYLTKTGEKKYPAVLKADTNHTWTNNSCIIVKLEDVFVHMGLSRLRWELPKMDRGIIK